MRITSDMKVPLPFLREILSFLELEIFVSAMSLDLNWVVEKRP